MKFFLHVIRYKYNSYIRYEFKGLGCLRMIPMINANDIGIPIDKEF